MKFHFKFLLATLLSAFATLAGRAQQQPVMAVTIQSIKVGATTFNPANESFGPTNATITISAIATGTFLKDSFKYSFFVNGISIGKTDTAVPPGFSADVQWAPPQPGAYFITVVADDGSNTATSLPVRYFATGTVVNSPSDNTLVPQGSTVVLKGDATPPGGFVKRIEFYDNGTLIGSDSTAPYSFIYTVPGNVGSPHAITAKAYDNNDALVGGTNTVNLQVINKIDVGTTSVISAPANNASITVPSGGSSIPISVDANSSSGRVNKVELYLDGALLTTANNPKFSFPYTFTWLPTIVGDYTLVALTYDDKNNVIASAPALVHIVPPPTVTVTSPSAGSTVIGGSPTTIKATASDGGGNGITSVQFFIDTLFVGQATTPTVPGGNEYQTLATFSQKVDSSGIPIPSVITAIAINSLGSSGVSPGVSVSVTNGGGGGGGTSIGIPPAVSVTAPVASSQLPVNQAVLVSGAAVDPDGNILSVQFFANNTAIGAPITTYPYNATWTPASLGSYTITAKATDNDGNAVTSAGVTVSVIDPAPNAPSVSVTAPANGSTVTVGLTQALRATATDSVGITSVQFFVNGQPLGGVLTAFPFTTPWSPTTPGTYKISARAINVSGNQTTSAPITVTVSGGVPPTAAVLTPAAGTSIASGLPVDLTANASDSDGTVASVRFLVNGNPVGSPSLVAPYTTPWTPTSAGNYSIVAEATDNVGNVSTSAARIVTVVPNQLPQVALLTPSSGLFTTAGLPVNLLASASDSDGTIARVRFLVNGNQIGTNITAPPFSLVWTPTSGGTYTIVAEATDNVGNVSTSTAAIVNVAANSLPNVTLTSPANGSTVRVNASTLIKATATDADGTIASVQFLVNGAPLATVTTFPYQTLWTPSAEGVYRITAVATDNAGAVASSGTLLAIGSANPGDAVSTGNYQGTSAAGGIENGSFASIASIGKSGAFIGYSTTAGLNKAYYYANIPVNVSGGYGLSDTSGRSLISGTANDTGTNGTLDAGRLSFIGINTSFLASGTALNSGFYSGTLVGKSTSKVAAIFGADGSIILYVLDGTFEDAAGGGFAGKVDSTGAFNLATMRGNRIVGKVDPNTRLLTGTLSGADSGTFSISPATLTATSTPKVAGAATEVRSNVEVKTLSSDLTYDQVLLQGSSATVTADSGQITRISFVDSSNDIVQVEFSGAGTLTLSLDDYSGPATAANYNQPSVSYVKGHAGIVISGADETSNLSIFTVGKFNAIDQSLFKDGVTYDGVADLAYVVILTTDGKFGGLRAADATFFATAGLTGICAPGVQFQGPVYVGDINASNNANPMFLFSSASDVRITGGSLSQSNGAPVEVGGLTQINFTDGMTSSGKLLPAQQNQARLQKNGVDVATQVVAQPAP
ncbi:MAG TPA: Ig-like domain-containing protein [Opitutaceae bacterium]|nr:Ig-like domain-containing protein [Opitutaceae bacterium]